MKIAFVGLGAMGLPMAQRLVSAGHEVIGCDLNDAPREALEDVGGMFTRSAAEAAANAEALVLMVVSGSQAETVLFESGAAEALANNALVVASCTQGRDDALRMGERLQGMGLRFLDAPVSGGAKGAASGTLTIMASGPRDVFDAARPVLEPMGDKLHHMGEEWGLGSLAKTINQHLAGVHIAAAAEAMALGQRAGLDGRTMLDVYTGSAAASWMLADRGPRMLEAEPGVTSAVDIFVKDLGLVLEAAETVGGDTPLARAAFERFRQASENGLGRQDDSQVIRAFRTKDSEA